MSKLTPCVNAHHKNKMLFWKFIFWSMIILPSFVFLWAFFLFRSSLAFPAANGIPLLKEKYEPQILEIQSIRAISTT